MAQARMAGPAMRADRVSPVAMTIRRRVLKASLDAEGLDQDRWAAS